MSPAHPDDRPEQDILHATERRQAAEPYVDAPYLQVEGVGRNRETCIAYADVAARQFYGPGVRLWRWVGSATVEDVELDAAGVFITSTFSLTCHYAAIAPGAVRPQ